MAVTMVGASACRELCMVRATDVPNRDARLTRCFPEAIENRFASAPWQTVPQTRTHTAFGMGGPSRIDQDTGRAPPKIAADVVAQAPRPGCDRFAELVRRGGADSRAPHRDPMDRAALVRADDRQEHRGARRLFGIALLARLHAA